MKIFIAEGYREDTPETNKIKRLFICENEEDTISKTNISSALNKNFTISLDRIELLIDSGDNMCLNKQWHFKDIFCALR